MWFCCLFLDDCELWHFLTATVSRFFLGGNDCTYRRSSAKCQAPLRGCGSSRTCRECTFAISNASPRAPKAEDFFGFLHFAATTKQKERKSPKGRWAVRTTEPLFFRGSFRSCEVPWAPPLSRAHCHHQSCCRHIQC